MASLGLFINDNYSVFLLGIKDSRRSKKEDIPKELFKPRYDLFSKPFEIWKGKVIRKDIVFRNMYGLMAIVINDNHIEISPDLRRFYLFTSHHFGSLITDTFIVYKTNVSYTFMDFREKPSDEFNKKFTYFNVIFFCNLEKIRMGLHLIKTKNESQTKVVRRAYMNQKVKTVLASNKVNELFMNAILDNFKKYPDFKPENVVKEMKKFGIEVKSIDYFPAIYSNYNLLKIADVVLQEDLEVGLEKLRKLIVKGDDIYNRLDELMIYFGKAYHRKETSNSIVSDKRKKIYLAFNRTFQYAPNWMGYMQFAYEAAFIYPFILLMKDEKYRPFSPKLFAETYFYSMVVHFLYSYRNNFKSRAHLEYFFWRFKDKFAKRLQNIKNDFVKKLSVLIERSCADKRFNTECEDWLKCVVREFYDFAFGFQITGMNIIIPLKNFMIAVFREMKEIPEENLKKLFKPVEEVNFTSLSNGDFEREKFLENYLISRESYKRSLEEELEPEFSEEELF